MVKNYDGSFERDIYPTMVAIGIFGLSLLVGGIVCGILTLI